MKYDLKRHKLLSILHVRTILFESDQLPPNESMGESFELLEKQLKCGRNKLNIISAELFKNNEIGYTDTYGIKGYYCDKNGVISYSNKKYSKRFYKDIVDFMNQLIPVLSLIIAIFALLISYTSLKVNNQKNAIEELQQDMKILSTKIDINKDVIDRIKHDTIFNQK